MAGGAFWQVGPEEADQLFAALGPVGFDGQGGQQGAHFVGLEGGYRLAVQRHPEGAKQLNCQVCHLYFLLGRLPNVAR